MDENGIMRVLENISNKQFSSFYVFSGDDIMYINKIINQLVESLDGVDNRIIHCNNLEQLPSSEHDVTIIVCDRYNKNLSDCVICDIRAVNWDYATLIQILSRECILNAGYIKEIVDISGRCYTTAMRMIQWMKLNSEVNGIDINKSYVIARENGYVYGMDKPKNYHFVDALVSGDKFRIMTYYKNVLNNTDDIMELLSLLHAQLKRVMVVQYAMESGYVNGVDKMTGLERWQVEHASRFFGIRSVHEILEFMDIVFDLMKSKADIFTAINVITCHAIKDLEEYG